MNGKLKKLALLSLGMVLLGNTGCDTASEKQREAEKQFRKVELENTHDHYAKLGKLNHTKADCVNNKLKFFNTSDGFKYVIVPNHIEHACEAINNK